MSSKPEKNLFWFPLIKKGEVTKTMKDKLDYALFSSCKRLLLFNCRLRIKCCVQNWLHQRNTIYQFLNYHIFIMHFTSYPNALNYIKWIFQLHVFLIPTTGQLYFTLFWFLILVAVIYISKPLACLCSSNSNNNARNRIKLSLILFCKFATKEFLTSWFEALQHIV